MVCRLCGSNNIDVLDKIIFKQDINDYLPEIYHILKCNNCGFCFDFIDISQEQLNKYYQFSHKYRDKSTIGSGGSSSEDLTRYSFVINTIKTYLPFEGNILDIGCGHGGLLKYIQNIRPNIKLYGVEPSLYLSEVCINQINFYKNITSLKEKKIKFDFIFCTHVLEHILDFNNFFNNLNYLINENTFLYFEVPNAADYGSKFKTPYYYIDREHINHFTEHSLENLLKKYSFITIFSNTNPWGIFNLCKFAINLNSKIIFDNLSEKFTDYISFSKNNDYIPNINNIDLTRKFFFYGLSAHLRRLLPKYLKNYSNFIIIDRDYANSNIFMDIPIKSKEFLFKPQNIHYNIFITSILYYEDIKKQLINDGFKGNIYRFF